MRNLLFTILVSLIAFAGYGQSQYVYSTRATGTNTYAAGITGFPGYGSADKGIVVDVKFDNANTAACTLSFNGASAVTLKKLSSGSLVDLASGDLTAGYTYRIAYNGTVLVVSLPGSGGGGGVPTSRTISTTAPLSGGGDLSGDRTLSITQATISTNGYLSSTDWNTFNGKQNSIPFGTGVLAALGVNIGSAGAPVLFNGAGGTPSSIVLTNATGTASGLTAGTVTTNANLTGDVTSVGNATTLATVNSNVGTFGSATTSPQFTVNGNGLITGVSALTITPAVGSITGFGTGIGTWLATPSSANLRGALTDEIGTGLFVTAPSGSTANQILGKNSGNTDVEWKSTSSGVALTKTNGTYITITLSGAATTALVNSANISADLTAIVPSTLGGTGADNSTQTYTPTLTNSANLTASTASQLQYYRVGNMVHVFGKITFDPITTATLTTLGISVPIASNFTTDSQASGNASANAVADNPAGILSDATNDRVTLQYICVDVTNHDMRISFSYQVL